MGNMIETARFLSLVGVLAVGVASATTFVVYADLSEPFPEIEVPLAEPAQIEPMAETVTDDVFRYVVLPPFIYSTSPLPSEEESGPKVTEVFMVPKTEDLSVKTESEMLTVKEVVPVVQKNTDRFSASLIEYIHAETNRERVKRGLAPLVYDAVLATNATTYSSNMLTNNFLAHVDLTGCDLTCRFAKSKYIADWWGENIAQWRSSYSPDYQEVGEFFMREWLKSAGHKENILSPNFTREGIGVAYENGEVIVTVHFSQP